MAADDGDAIDGSIPNPQEFLELIENMREMAVSIDRFKQQFIELGWDAWNAEQITITVMNRLP